MSNGFFSFQAVAFFAGFTPTSSAAKLWMELFEEPYANHQTPSPGISIANGVVDGYQFELHLHPERVDVIVRPFDDQPGPLKLATDLDDLASRALSKLLNVVPRLTVVRVAAVTTSVTNAKSQADAGIIMAQEVPNLPVVGDFTDQMFQVNKPFDSKIQGGLTLNRLCRWTATVGMDLALEVGSMAPPVTRATYWSVHTMVDINSAPPIRPDPALIPQLFSEFIEEAKVVSTEGFARLV